MVCIQIIDKSERSKGYILNTSYAQTEEDIYEHIICT